MNSNRTNVAVHQISAEDLTPTCFEYRCESCSFTIYRTNLEARINPGVWIVFDPTGHGCSLDPLSGQWRKGFGDEFNNCGWPTLEEALVALNKVLSEQVAS